MIEFDGSNERHLVRERATPLVRRRRNPQPEHVPEKLALLKAHCEHERRNFAEVQIAVSPYANVCDRDMLKRYEDAGVHQVVLAAFVPGQDALERVIEGYAKTLL